MPRAPRSRILLLALLPILFFSLGLTLNLYQQRRAALAARIAQFPDYNLGTQILPLDQITPSPIYFPSTEHIDDYTENLAAIQNREIRTAIARVLPACAAVDSGSGVCISPTGDILTNAHVALALGRQMIVRFPDGARAVMTCRALNRKLDLAIVTPNLAADVFPFATLARQPANLHDTVVAVGQPAPVTPDGEPTGFKPFHISVGQITALDPNPRGDQHLGRLQHNAWTYWGHSGSPLFNARGEIVALHNSWDATCGHRHAIPLQPIMDFLHDAGL